MTRKSGLGRGLGALIPAEYTESGGSMADVEGMVEVPIAAVTPNPRQPRSHFDEESLAGLTASISELGVLQPVLVRAADEGRFELIAGERRWRAAKRAGLQTIPVVVRNADTEVELLEQALVENLHRADLNAIEEAAAYQQLIEDFGLTQEAVATRVGKSRAAVSNTLRLFQLPPAIQGLVADGQLSADVDAREIPPLGFENLSQEGNGVAVTGDFAAGDYLALRLGFDNGTTVAIKVPVVTNCDEFEGFDHATQDGEDGDGGETYDCEPLEPVRDYGPGEEGLEGDELEPEGGAESEPENTQ